MINKTHTSQQWICKTYRGNDNMNDVICDSGTLTTNPETGEPAIKWLSGEIENVEAQVTIPMYINKKHTEWLFDNDLYQWITREDAIASDDYILQQSDGEFLQRS